MMSEDIKVPKEQFLVDYFKSKKQQSPAAGKPFNEVLNTIQIKIEKKSLEELQSSGSADSSKKIDDLEPKQAVSLLKETIDTLRSISG